MTVKQQVQQMLEKLSDDVTYDDIQYHLYVRQKIQRGEADIAAGRWLTHEEVEKRMDRWLNPSVGPKRP